MRTNIDIEDGLMTAALKATGARTKREAVERALRQAVRLSGQADVRNYRGKLYWEGDLEAMRTDR